jgi:hypothetical protein
MQDGPATYPCPRCGADNYIVNQCGCDPDNLPTRVPPPAADPHLKLIREARDSIVKTWAYVAALRQAVYSRVEAYRSADMLAVLDSLSRAEWPDRERLVKDLSAAIGEPVPEPAVVRPGDVPALAAACRDRLRRETGEG